MERRSLFQMMFGRKPRADTIYNQLKLLNGYNAVFTTWGNDPYSADVVRGAVDAIARNAAKLKPKHIKRTGKDMQPVGGQVERVLQVRPNPNMSTYDFLYKMVTALLMDNNAFAYPVWEGATLKAVWPVIAQQTEFIEDQLGQIGVRFWFSDDSIILPYDEVIHLRRHYYKNDLAGENNKALNSTLEAIHTTNEGLGQAVKTSATLRGILKYQGILKEADIKANRDRFVEEYLVVQNNGGVAALDSKADYTELKSQPLMVDAAQMKELRENIYRYFGVNEKIITGSYSEQDWDAFYESTLEPLAVQLSLEFTYKLFTANERTRGHEIIFEANRLQYVSTKTKVQMLKDLAPLGLFTINEGREIFNLAPVEGGDKRIQTLNVVDADKAGKYQLGEEEDRSYRMCWYRRYEARSEASDELDKVKTIIKSLSKEEKKELGPRFFYDDAQYRYIEENDGAPIGFIENRITGKKGHFNVAIHPNHRGKGIADKMVKKAIKAAPDLELDKIYWITTPENEASRGLAEKHGFELKSENDDEARYILEL